MEQETLKEKLRDKERVIQQLKSNGNPGYAGREIQDEKDNEILKLKEELTNLKKIANLPSSEKDSLRFPEAEVIHKIHKEPKDDLKSSQKWGNNEGQFNNSSSWMPNASIKSFITNPGSINYSSRSLFIQIKRSLLSQTTVTMSQYLLKGTIEGKQRIFTWSISKARHSQADKKCRQIRYRSSFSSRCRTIGSLIKVACISSVEIPGKEPETAVNKIFLSVKNERSLDLSVNRFSSMQNCRISSLL